MKRIWILMGFALAACVAEAEEICGAPKTQARAELIWTKVLCKEEGRQIGWPTVCLWTNGEILVAFSGDRDGHVCPWGKDQIVRSADNGKTWSPPVTVNCTPIDDRDAGILCLQNGHLVLSWFSSLHFENKVIMHRWNQDLKSCPTPWEIVRLHDEKIPQAEKDRWCAAFSRRSTDGGRTWDEPVRTFCQTPHGPIQLRDGRLLHVGCVSSNRTTRIGVGTPGIIAAESCDEGLTWKKIGTLSFPPEEQSKALDRYCEPHVIETTDGRLVTLLRYEDSDRKPMKYGGSLWQSESKDGGRTWTEASYVLEGYPPHLLHLRDGKIALAYGKRGGGEKVRGEYVCLSDDQCRTWDTKNEIKLVKGLNVDLGYPSSVQLADGTILTVYYQAEKAGEKPCLMGTLWKVTK